MDTLLIIIIGLNIVLVVFVIREYYSALKEIQKQKQDETMDAKNLDRPTVGECQDLFNRLGIQSTEHNGTTTDLCAVILKLEQGIGKKRLEQMIEDDTFYILGE